MIDSFIKNTKDIIKQTTAIDMFDMKAYETNKLILGEYINVTIGVSGVVSGQITLGFSENLALYISSKMQGDVMLVTIDDLVKKSIFEICKIIVGNACASLYDSGVAFKITFIGIINGESFEYSSVEQVITCIPFEANQGKMFIYLQLSNINDKHVDDF